MSLNETKQRLRDWGRWANGGMHGYPSESSSERINGGGRSTALKEANPDLLRTDHIVGCAELKLRRILIRHYCTAGSGREKALRMTLPKSTYFQLLNEAEWFVMTELDKPDNGCYLTDIVGVLTAIPKL